jgi:luciferase family oxidoreductase group 1
MPGGADAVDRIVTQIPLSVLDLAPVATGSSVGTALRHTTTLAQRAEELGYRRFWVAEHHNMPGIASAAHTSTIRIGSGGVMLPNHAPLVVAEQFGTLEALHPGRVDLGIGRAPGTDQLTALALRRTAEGLNAEDFPRELGALIGYFQGDARLRITATPGKDDMPAIWLLGSSGYSAQLAGLLGLPFAFAHHFSGQNTVAALALYRENFRPSAHLDRPYTMIGVNAICADTDEQAQWLSGPSRLAMIRLRQGRPGQLPTPQEAAAYPYTPAEREVADQRFVDQALGSPETVRRQLQDLLARTRVDELMLTTMVFDIADRIRSFELIAEKVAPELSTVD